MYMCVLFLWTLQQYAQICTVGYIVIRHIVCIVAKDALCKLVCEEVTFTKLANLNSGMLTFGTGLIYTINFIMKRSLCVTFSFLDDEKSAQSLTNCKFRVFKPDRRVL